MDILKMLTDLRQEREQLGDAIIALERATARNSANLEHRIRTWPRTQPVIRFKPLDCIVDHPEQRAA
jgi:hypothetical protein